MNNELLEQARKICLNLLEIDQPVNSDKISKAIDQVVTILPGVTEFKTILFERIQSVYGITLDEPKILDDYQPLEPWIKDERAKSGKDWKFWVRYRDFLTEDKGFPPLIVDRLDDLTDKILDRLGNPHQSHVFDRRGMVVGHVQSGKTSNYIGLVCKAADAGYKLIVVLAGVHNSLRSQTQLRVDEGFLGYDTATSRTFSNSNNRIGVGRRLDQTASAHSITSNAPNGDFKKSVAETVNFNLNGHDPVVLVVKKNYSVLKNLITWLAGKAGETVNGTENRVVKNIPLLLIDDEADNASINISKAYVSSINGAIRSLLQLFEQSAYVGYTATPYANIFIEPPSTSQDNLKKGIKLAVGDQLYEVGDDLFPRNFIINLPAPSNYVGPEKIFAIATSESVNDDPDQDGAPIPLYRIVTDHQPKDYHDSERLIEELRLSNHNYIPDKHRMQDALPEVLPESLKKALKCFVLSCAGRRARGHENVHNSMLVHVTRFVDWQNNIALKIKEELLEYRRQIEFNQTEFISRLRDLWENEFVPVTQRIINHVDINDPDIKPILWTEVESYLFSAISKIQIRAVHGGLRSKDGLTAEDLQPLDYFEHKKGLSVIAVGGDKLSRGLTLEGLSISYYLRSSKMYDTLMQMGRWFGYRPGYLDLCRLFTSEELVSFYRHITIATEEMRNEFDRMFLLKKQPLDFGLKIRTHSGALIVTAANKFRYKKIMSFSFSEELEETYLFNRRGSEFKNNFDQAKGFIENLGVPTGLMNTKSIFRNQKYIWHFKDNWEQVANFIYSFKSTQHSFIPRLISDYIVAQAKNNIGLQNWTIALIDNTRVQEPEKFKLNETISIGLSFRKDATTDPENSHYNESGEWYEITKAHIIGNFHEYIDLGDAQIQIALEQTINDWKTIGKEPKSKEHPNTLRIRRNRSDKNGLLLIYPLDPQPDKNQAAYSDSPIIGLAVSFPYIENDRRVEYAVNQVFQNEIFDYPEQFDQVDTYGDQEDETELPALIRTTMSLETFKELIESPLSAIRFIDETEIDSGVVYRKLIDESIEEPNLVAPFKFLEKGKFTDYKYYPFYEASELQRYAIPAMPSWAIINPNEEYEPGEIVVGLKNSRYTLFSFSDELAYFPDSCWIIRPGQIDRRYLTALLNSSLFGAWVRVSGQRKKDRYFITNDVLTDFPIVLPKGELLGPIKTLVDCVRLLIGIKASEAGPMISYFSDIIDSVLFCIYFPDSMSDSLETLVRSFAKFPAITMEGGDMKSEIEAVRKLYTELHDKTHPVRQLTHYIDKYGKVNRIRGVFIEETDTP